MKQKLWELNGIDYENICTECQETNEMADSDVKNNCPYYHECLPELAQEKLLNYIKSNGKTLDELEAIVNQLYVEFGIK